MILHLTRHLNQTALYTARRRQVIGTATCIGYGKVGWFGNLIVDASYRRHGLGKQLLQKALQVLQAKGVTTVGCTRIYIWLVLW
jgi:GNAT superfamily N-acetyltransferase